MKLECGLPRVLRQVFARCGRLLRRRLNLKSPHVPFTAYVSLVHGLCPCVEHLIPSHGLREPIHGQICSAFSLHDL